MSATRSLTLGAAVLAAAALLAYAFWPRALPDSTEAADPVPEIPNVVRAETPEPVPTEFPAAELRSALTDACSNAATEAPDEELTAEERQALLEAYNEREQRLLEILSASPIAEHLHVAALLVDDPVSRFELLDAAIARSPGDPFLLWDAVRMCTDSIEAAPCPLRKWERLLIAADGQNSEAWIRIAANRYADGDNEAALDAMRHASTAAETRAYWTETIEIIERGYAAGSDFSFPERASTAFAFAGAKLPRYRDYFRMCDERSANSADWAYACLAYGELVENQGKSSMGVSIARSIQTVVLKALAEADKAAEVQRRAEAERQVWLRSYEDGDLAEEMLILLDPTLFHAYLAAIRAEGEVAARRKLNIEIKRLLAQQPELGCPWEHM
ncbi:MAG: hypothetical protein AAGD86_00805 [Pseudomonadota bacterium]